MYLSYTNPEEPEMKRTIIALAALTALTACGGHSSSPQVITVNNLPINSVPTCSSFVGRVLTVADETGVCDQDGVTSPASATQCSNGLTYIILSSKVAGLLGKPAVATTDVQTLDRSTCAVTP